MTALFLVHFQMIQSYWQDLLHVFFPDACAACHQGLLHGEHVICTDCHLELPRTGFHKRSPNPLENQLVPLAPIEAATALWYFNKGARVQRLIHGLKYHGETRNGLLAGRMLGRELSTSPRFHGLHGIIPVPLHASKLRKRGYNQSDFFAQGISESLQIPVMNNSLMRRSHSTSQTIRRRFERHAGVEHAFGVLDIGPGHYLLVDDVVTTGATLVACSTALTSVANVRVSVATMAYARR
ncbi:MAG: ComF family protein [Bacteroidota bacterium]